MSALSERLDAIISRYRLLDHPFYQAWNDGTLPVDALRTYASEYGAFIGLVPKAWAAHGDNEIADVEREHYDLWQQFAGALDTEVAGPQLPAVTHLVETVDGHCATPARSMGTLYAFEIQQPDTAKSKLEGLDTHYTQLASGVRTYFEVHVDDVDEPALLLQRMQELSAEEQEAAVQACEETASALYDALTDIHRQHCVIEA